MLLTAAAQQVAFLSDDKFKCVYFALEIYYYMFVIEIIVIIHDRDGD